jgi:hypothetical protein
MSVPFQNAREFTATFIRPGGPGNKWRVFDQDGAAVDGPTGGAADVEQRFGLDAFGNTVYLGAFKSGDPAPFTTTISIRPDLPRMYLQNAIGNCPFDLVVLQRCGNLSILNYNVGLEYDDGNVTSTAFDNPIAKFAEGGGAVDDIMRTFDTTFSPTLSTWMKLRHADLSGTVSDFAINKVINVDSVKCVGDCFGSESDGTRRFWAVTDRDSTPGYQSIATARFLFTEDGGTNWTTTVSGNYINAAPNADALDVVRVNLNGRETALVALPTAGVAYAAFEDIQTGAVNPWSLSTTGFTAPNYPRALFATDSQTVYACAANGYIYKSTDAGLSWTALSSGGLTTQTLNSISFSDKTTGMAVGASGAAVLIRDNGATQTLTLVTVRTAVGGAAVTANFNVVAMRPGVPGDAYIGTATGLVYRTLKDNFRLSGSLPLFELVTFADSGSGSVADLKFAGYKGTMLWMVQTNSNGNSRVLRDVSGGGGQWEVIGGYTSPGNFGINSIAPTPNINFALTGGEVHETYAFIGKLEPGI